MTESELLQRLKDEEGYSFTSVTHIPNIGTGVPLHLYKILAKSANHIPDFGVRYAIAQRLIGKDSAPLLDDILAMLEPQLPVEYEGVIYNALTRLVNPRTAQRIWQSVMGRSITPYFIMLATRIHSIKAMKGVVDEFLLSLMNANLMDEQALLALANSSATDLANAAIDKLGFHPELAHLRKTKAPAELWREVFKVNKKAKSSQPDISFNCDVESAIEVFETEYPHLRHLMKIHNVTRDHIASIPIGKTVALKLDPSLQIERVDATELHVSLYSAAASDYQP